MPIATHPWRPHRSQHIPENPTSHRIHLPSNALPSRNLRGERWKEGGFCDWCGFQGCAVTGGAVRGAWRLAWSDAGLGDFAKVWATSTWSDDHGTHQLTTNPARDPSISADWAGSWADQWSIKRLRVRASRVEESQSLPAVRLFLTKIFIHSLLTLLCPIYSQTLRTMNVKITWKNGCLRFELTSWIWRRCAKGATLHKTHFDRRLKIAKISRIFSQTNFADPCQCHQFCPVTFCDQGVQASRLAGSWNHIRSFHRRCWSGASPLPNPCNNSSKICPAYKRFLRP